MSVLPPPIISGHTDISNEPGFIIPTTGVETQHESNPSVAVDPLHPNILVAAWTDHQLAEPPTIPTDQVSVEAQYSTDGGHSWSALPLPANLLDPTTVKQGSPATAYPFSLDASVAFDRQEHFYIVYREASDITTSNQGAIVLNSFDLNTLLANPSQPQNAALLQNKIVYQWATNRDQAFNPVVAVDSNVLQFPSTGPTQTDPYSGNVYVSWNTSYAPPATNPPLTFNPNSVKLVVSSDQGNTFSSEVYLNPDKNLGANSGSPSLTVSQGVPGKTPGGQVLAAWDEFGPIPQLPALPTPAVDVAPVSAGASITKSDQTGGHINDPLVTGTTADTDFSFTVLPGDFSSTFTTLSKLTVQLNLRHPDLSQLRIQLISPDNQVVTLVQNGRDPLGNPLAQGITGTTLGLVNPTLPDGSANFQTQLLGVTFDDDAPRSIRDGVATRFGLFSPEFPATLSLFNGRDIMHLIGTWTLHITDFVAGPTNPPVAPELYNWSLTFTSGLQRGNVTRTPLNTVILGAVDNNNPTKAVASPTLGVGPAPQVASDNTLGAASRFAGRLYLVYVDRNALSQPLLAGGTPPAGSALDETGILLRYSDDGGKTWSNPTQISDNNPQTGYTGLTMPLQYEPNVTVDQYTGTLVVTYSDTRFDAARARMARMLTTSIDGGQTFSNSVFLDLPQLATDAITGKQVTVEPITANQSGGSPTKDPNFGVGAHQGLAVAAGHVYALWATNINASNDPPNTWPNPPPGPFNWALKSFDIWTADVTIAAGPRIVGGTPGGPVQATTVHRFSDNAPITFNNLTASDGSPEVNGFVVTFDRIIDPTTFDPSDVKVEYRSPFVPASSPPTPVTVGQIVQVGLTSFLVLFQTPQAGVGTYSYAVGPNIRDTIAYADVNGNVLSPGNLMDQNGNAVTGENPGDVFDAPHALSGHLFVAPYDPNTLPLILPGPHVIKTFVPNQPLSSDNLVLNQANNMIDVTFDRDMRANTFTAPQVLRIVGPNGVIPGPYTVVPDPQPGEDPNFPRTFRITFPLVAGSGNGRASGTYTVTFGPNIMSKSGLLMDQNLNAGLDNLRTTSSTNAVTTTVLVQSSDVPKTLAPNQIAVSNLTVTDPFSIQGLTLKLNISVPNDADLVGTLVAPDGTRIRLFTHVASGVAGFNITTLDDNATTPIQSASTPSLNGTFNPQTPLSVLLGKGSAGTYQLVLENDSSSDVGSLNSWSITFQKATPGTGLGENASDDATASFRIFTMDINNPASHNTWSQVGPIANNTPINSGEITTAAVDPSDPSGNTVYIGAATGGVWKTTNFLTPDAAGPTYVPLTDFGPNQGVNIGSITVFPRNNDPNQSIILVGTGNSLAARNVAGASGVGFLLSIDGGATWQLLDSSTNVDTAGNPLPFNSPARDHAFVGTSILKVTVDPTLSPSNQVIVYAAVNDPSAAHTSSGVWRSLDGGKHWTKVLAATTAATDVILAPASAAVNTNNLQIVYAALSGQGVFISPNQGNTWQQMLGNVGDPLIQDVEINQPPTPLRVNTSSGPTNASGVIHLATPFLTHNPAADKQYEGWLYVNANGKLFMTKDFGQNWVQVRVPGTVGAATTPNLLLPTINKTAPDVPLGNNLAIDPNNPNIIYVDRIGPGTFFSGDPFPFVRTLRVDTTGIWDAHFFIAWSNHNPDGGQGRQSSIGALTVPNTFREYVLVSSPGQTQAPDGSTPYINLLRDPSNPFLVNSTVVVHNATAFTNDGSGTVWTQVSGLMTIPQLPGVEEGYASGDLGDFILALPDTLSGNARLVLGTIDGIYTGVVDASGTVQSSLGTYTQTSGIRTGNLQIAEMNFGASQPSIIAAQAAQALLYATSTLSHTHSDPNILSNGNLIWAIHGNNNVFELAISGNGVATDQTGSGTAYHFLSPGFISGILNYNSNFFRITPAGGNELSRMFGLIQTPTLPDPQWVSALRFAVNPINGNQIVMSSGAGRIFRSEDQGITWFVIGNPTDLDSSYAQAMAYGAPDPGAAPGNLDNFIYAGTTNGHIFVTFNGGGNGQTNGWIPLSNGLAGGAVQVISADPIRGNKDAYAVTSGGVFRMNDSSATGAKWTDITGNLFQLIHQIYGDSTATQQAITNLTSLAVDWRFRLPDGGGATTTHPVLYVGGNAGVFRSIDGGKTWTLFPDMAHDGSAADGGFLPRSTVTSLTIEMGNINPTTGQPDVSGGPDILYATTFGRGAYAIRLQNNVTAGPRVISFTPGQTTGPVSSVIVTFNGSIDPSSFTVATIGAFRGPQGVITPLSVVDLDPTMHKKFQINFPTQTAFGTYTLTFGPYLQDFSGNFMDQNANGINAQGLADTYTGHFTISQHLAPPEYAVGADAGGGPEVRVFNGQTGAKLFDFFAYDPHYTGGVRVAMGDVNNDGVPDIVVAPGLGSLPDIRVYDGITGVLIREFFAYPLAFHGGVNIAVADVNGDGYADIITGADAGAAPHVEAWSGKDGSLLYSFFAFPTSFTGGVRVAAGDINGDGFADIVTAAGPGGAPQVIEWSGKDLSMIRTFLAYGAKYTAGVTVATGDINRTGRDDVITGTGFGATPNVRVYNGVTGSLLYNFFAFPPSFTGGIRVGSISGLSADGGDAIIVGAGPSSGPAVEIFDGSNLAVLDNFFALDPRFTGGVFVGGH